MRSYCKHLEDWITIRDIKICCQLGNSYQIRAVLIAITKFPRMKMHHQGNWELQTGSEIHSISRVLL